MSDFIYNLAKKKLFDGSLDLLADTLVVMLVDTGYSAVANPDQTAIDDGTANDAASHEVSGGSGYVGGHLGSGRKALASRVAAVDYTNDRASFDADDTVWAAPNGFTAGGAVLLKVGATNDTDALPIAFFDFADTVMSGVQFTLQWASGGVLRIT